MTVAAAVWRAAVAVGRVLAGAVIAVIAIILLCVGGAIFGGRL